jgi:hypothetical protein
MEENFNTVAMLIIAAIAWAKLSYDAGKRKGNLEGRKAVRKHYERVSQ